MLFRKIATALFACLALGAFAANATQAAEGEGWTIEGSGAIPWGTHQGVSCEKHGTSTLIFTSLLLGLQVELSAEGVDCAAFPGSVFEATIDNTVSNGHSEGALEFTGVKVLKPSTKCSVRSQHAANGEITTEQLTDEVIMDPSGSTAVLDRFFRDKKKEGEKEVEVPLFTIEFAGAECPLNEASAPMKGSVCGEGVHTDGFLGYEPNKTGDLKVVQTLLFGEAQQKTGNSFAKPCALTLGIKAAQITGAVDTRLSFTNVGKAFGVD